jgi:predicted nucleic acid-binding protein
VGQVVVDASVVIALRDRDDAHHRAAEKALTGARDQDARLTLPASAFAESLVRPLAAGADEDEAAAALTKAFTIAPLTQEIALKAAVLRATTTLRSPDALVVATGICLDADRILTCDRAWRTVDRRVHVLRGT